ncbi:hypothetical protein KI387_002034, partial [Taxus chinensis]
VTTSGIATISWPFLFTSEQGLEKWVSNSEDKIRPLDIRSSAVQCCGYYLFLVVFMTI